LTHRTYAAVTAVRDTQDRALCAYGEHFGRAVRSAYAWQERATRRGRPLETLALKHALMQRLQLTARQTNAVIREAAGKRSAIVELRKERIGELKRRKATREREVTRLSQQWSEHVEGTQRRLSPSLALKVRRRLHWAKTALSRLSAELERLQAEHKAGVTHLTFGTKKRLRQRGALVEARKTAEALPPGAKRNRALRALARQEQAWQDGWYSARNNQFLVLGSKDETAGCQGAVITAQPNGLFSLKIRLPDALAAEHGLYVELTDVRVPYGREHLEWALRQQEVRQHAIGAARLRVKDAQARGEPAKYRQANVDAGCALTWRLVRAENGGWTAWFSLEVPAAPLRSSRRCAARARPARLAWTSTPASSAWPRSTGSAASSASTTARCPPSACPMTSAMRGCAKS